MSAPNLKALIAEYRALGGDVQFVADERSSGIYTRFPLVTSPRSREIEQAMIAVGDDAVAAAIRQEAGE